MSAFGLRFVSQYELLDRIMRSGEHPLDVDGFEWRRTLRYYPCEVDHEVDRVPAKCVLLRMTLTCGMLDSQVRYPSIPSIRSIPLVLIAPTHDAHVRHARLPGALPLLRMTLTCGMLDSQVRYPSIPYIPLVLIAPPHDAHVRHARLTGAVRLRVPGRRLAAGGDPCHRPLPPGVPVRLPGAAGVPPRGPQRGGQDGALQGPRQGGACVCPILIHFE
eukprot:1180721-Prorocentrum_minimum.AAC.1